MMDVGAKGLLYSMGIFAFVGLGYWSGSKTAENEFPEVKAEITKNALDSFKNILRHTTDIARVDTVATHITKDRNGREVVSYTLDTVRAVRDSALKPQ